MFHNSFIQQKQYPSKGSHCNSIILFVLTVQPFIRDFQMKTCSFSLKWLGVDFYTNRFKFDHRSCKMLVSVGKYPFFEINRKVLFVNTVLSWTYEWILMINNLALIIIAKIRFTYFVSRSKNVNFYGLRTLLW